MKLKVLVPLDGSSFSAQVLSAVARLFAPDTAELTLVHVASPPKGVMPPPPAPRPVTVDGWTTFMDAEGREWARELAEHPIYTSQVWESVRAELEADLADELQTVGNAGFTVSLSVHFGDPADEIIRLANDADLIAMATHGRSGLPRALMGSVASEVMRRASVPVMMVRSVNTHATASG